MEFDGGLVVHLSMELRAVPYLLVLVHAKHSVIGL